MDIETKIVEKNPEISQRIKDIKLRKAAKELEAIFIAQVIKAMEKTLPDGAIGGKKNNLVNMLFSSTMGKAIAESGGIGLSEIIYRSLKKRGIDEPVNGLQAEEYLKCLELIKGRQIISNTGDEE